MLIQKNVAGVPDVFTGASKRPRCHELTPASRVFEATLKNKPWFVLADVCKVLEIANPSDLKKRLNSEDVNTLDLTEGNQTRGNPRKVVVNESGLYDVTDAKTALTCSMLLPARSRTLAVRWSRRTSSTSPACTT